MGYERNIYVVSEDLNFAETIATFDLCCCYGLEDVFEDTADYPLQIMETDGDTEISEDKYGVPIKVADPEPVIRELRKIYRNEHYWRAKCAADLIGDIVRNCNTRDVIRIYSFGY